MRILVTGACGLLGAHLSACLAREHEVAGMDRNPWWGDGPLALFRGDLMDFQWVSQEVRRFSPEVLIHCAGMANVDACERDPERAKACNVEMTRLLVRAAPAGCLFLYISTDGIFRGEEPFAREDTPPHPLTVYGRTKLQGEREVMAAIPNHLILRTNFYGWSSGRKLSAAEWLYGAIQRGEAITLFEDFFFTPIYAAHLAERVRALLKIPYRGILHLGGSERVSKSRFGELLAEMAGFSLANARRGSLRDAQLAAPRPRDMSLDCSRYRRWTGMELPDCRAGLSQFLLDRGVSLSGRFSRMRPAPVGEDSR